MSPRRCTGCRAPEIEWAAFVVVPAVLPLPGVYCRACLARRDEALAQRVEPVA